MVTGFNRHSTHGNAVQDDPSLAQAKSYIYAIDFSQLIDRLIREEGWSRKSAFTTCELYRNFLFLNRKFADQGVLPPSEEVDEFWHAHILDTEKYVNDCQVIFGKYFHHYPYLVMDHQMNYRDLNKTFEITQELHLQEFGTYIYAARSKFEKIKAQFYKIIKLIRG